MEIKAGNAVSFNDIERVLIAGIMKQHYNGATAAREAVGVDRQATARALHGQTVNWANAYKLATLLKAYAGQSVLPGVSQSWDAFAEMYLKAQTAKQIEDSLKNRDSR